jgi:hypothetical protein
MLMAMSMPVQMPVQMIASTQGVCLDMRLAADAAFEIALSRFPEQSL